MSHKYYVWKRNDGYVSACTYMPQGWKTTRGDEVTFELLKTFDKWDNEIIDFIETNQCV